MIRFEMVRPESNTSKFWEIGPNGNTRWEVKVAWGRIGSTGQSIIKSFPSSIVAESFIEARVFEKLNQGYKRVTPLPSAKPPRAGVAFAVDRFPPFPGGPISSNLGRIIERERTGLSVAERTILREVERMTPDLESDIDRLVDREREREGAWMWADAMDEARARGREREEARRIKERTSKLDVEPLTTKRRITFEE